MDAYMYVCYLVDFVYIYKGISVCGNYHTCMGFCPRRFLPIY